MRRPASRLDIVRRECRTRGGAKKLRLRMRQRGFCTRSFARDLVDATGAEVTSDPVGSLRLARFCVQIARRSGDRCCHARSVGLLSDTRRLLGQLDRAERTLKIAFNLADGCPCCQPPLYRGLAFLRINQNRPGLAMRASERAVEIGSNRGGNVENGRSLLCRAIVRGKRGHLRKALNDVEKVLQLLPKDDAQFSVALYTYAVILAQRRDPASVKRASELLPVIEESFQGCRGLSVERAKLTWLHGEVARAQENDRQALRDLERARSAFVRLKMALELAAVCADISAIQAKRPWPMEAVRLLFAATADDAKARGIVFPAELRTPIDRVLQATRSSLTELRPALRELRDVTVDLDCPPPILSYP